MYDVAIIGGGMAGMATAARLQAQGLSTVVLEAHGQVGGCAGFYRRKGFSFDVGATTLVDFEPGGVGDELLQAVGMSSIAGEQLPGYVAWLPDRQVTLHRDQSRWSVERLQKLGDTPAHHRFWRRLDRIANVFWRASRRGVRLPIRSAADVVRAVRSVGWEFPQARYLNWTMGDALRADGLRGDKPLCALLSMLIEDTVHSALDEAPLINGALGVTIRGAGLTRASGGMRGFWRAFTEQHQSLGGRLQVGCRATHIEGELGRFAVHTRRGMIAARQIVSAVPIELTARLGPPNVRRRLEKHVRRDASRRGGAMVVFLGVPEEEVAGQDFTHHQLLHDYSAPLGGGNNMFVSVSAPGDIDSAPPGFRAVMISTHCDLAPWQALSEQEYRQNKDEAGRRLIALARRAYPQLADNPIVCETGTPRTYERFTSRPLGAVGGVRQCLDNTNQRAVGHDLGAPGFHLAGDTTWPGLGTVACAIGSRLVAENVMRCSRRIGRSASRPAMPTTNESPAPPLPDLQDLGRDLLTTTKWQRRMALTRPFLGLAAFALAAMASWWWLTPLLVFLIFVAVVIVTHDVVHGSLGLSRRQSDWALFLFGAMLLESGHAYRLTHAQHHRVFPGADDPEGDPARMTFWQAALQGPIFLPRLWWWAFRRAKGDRRTRAWLVAEALWAISFPIAAMALWPLTAAPLAYAILVLVGSWSYPLLTVHLPHHDYGESPLTQTHTLRGRVIPALFLELTYHLEHHLYPQVPSHNLAKLSKRLEPLFRRAGVRPRQVL